ncbi:Outer membrane receptor proteins, mostly Fe transport [Bacteroides heparinolyticus]|uniref:Outer membrane receptor proteins, mostly Fe transport n=1 Tax=Prevotella heparinolytica TaxID=28113 RepID=A0A449I1D1_9BACE|nr:SusC/RagA family TonB-linked outer membrane protein [Bacteroides heparinolyticus]VFB13157.1 Outer membrane receptor proteins, mostly Fe transport [Bacteroides heparinolyticus]
MKEYYEMKYCLLTLLLCTFAHLNGYAQVQTVTINVKNASLKQVFSSIEKQTTYRFSYRNEQIDNRHDINVSKVNASVSVVLDEALSGRNLEYTIVSSKSIVISTKVSQTPQKLKLATRTVSGVIKDIKGDPVIGASVFEKGTQNGTVTDIDGRFLLNISDNNLLTISYIGFMQQEVRPSNNIVITLKEDTQMLEEVVVVGYGTKKKANLIGAVSTITADKLKDRPISSIGQALQGQVPNLNISFASGTPGEVTRLNIRGATSIINSGSPLILIDGVEGSMDRLNPNDIESISVLKDAASAAIYGARAGFGVILITTKSNKDNKAHINYNGRFSWSDATTKTDFITTGYDAARIVDTFNLAMNNSSYTNYTQSDYAELEKRRYDTTENPDRPWVVVGSDGKYRYYGNFDWYNYLFDFSQPTWNHNLNISGGTESFNYLVSGNMNDKNGVYAQNQDKYQTRTISGKFTSQVNSWFRLSATAMLFKSKYRAPGYDYEDGGNFGNLMFHAMPYVMPYNPDGSNVYTYAPSSNRPADGFAAMIRTGKGFTEVKNTQSTYSLNAMVHLTDGLDLIGNASYRLYSKDKTFRTASFQYSERPDVLQTASTGFFQNRLRETHTEEEYHVYDLYANYQKTLNAIHNLNIVIGMNYEEGRYKNIGGRAADMLSENLNDLSLGTGTKTVYGGQHEYALMGYFGRASYDYAGKYLAEVNMRYDGTSRFPSDNRWGFFPSIALGWRFSDEVFFNPTKSWLTNGKLRVSIGSLGNQVTDGYSNPYYPYVRRVSVASTSALNYIFGDNVASYIRLDAPVSGSLTWEKIVTANIGLDLGFFNNRLTATADLYQRDTKDMLATSLTLPNVYGYTAPLENNGHLRTRGYELSLSWNDRFILGNKSFSYGVTISLADSQSRLVAYKGNETKILGRYYEGMEWGEIWGYQIDGIYKTDAEATARGVDQSFLGSRFTNQAGDLIFRDIDGNKKIDNGKGTLEEHGDLVKLGNSTARYHYGFSLTTRWNGIDFSAFFQGIGKWNVYPGGNNMMFWGPYARSYSSFIPVNFESRVWTTDNQNAYFPRAAADLARTGVMCNVNDRYLQNLAYCRLKNLTIGYTLPSVQTRKIKLDAVRFYFSGDNLLTITALKSDYLDPEQMTTDSNGRVYPYSKSFSFGIDVTF